MSSSEQGVKYDGGKVQMRLLPWEALEKIAEVMSDAVVKKYPPGNWRHVTPFEDRYKDAGLRHLFSYLAGDLVDKDSGLEHLAHAITNFLFLLEGGNECQDTITHAIDATPMGRAMTTTSLPKKRPGQMIYTDALNVDWNSEGYGDSWEYPSRVQDLQGRD